MDFEAFERIALQSVFETNQPLTPGFLAYRSRLPVAVVERYLAVMLERGTLAVRVGKSDGAEYFLPGARRPAAAEAGTVGAGSAQAVRPRPLLAVCLSVLLPGAGHIYVGHTRSGAAWMASTLMGYACFVVPGVLLHGLCLLSASRLARIS